MKRDNSRSRLAQGVACWGNRAGRDFPGQALGALKSLKDVPQASLQLLSVFHLPFPRSLRDDQALGNRVPTKQQRVSTIGCVRWR